MENEEGEVVELYIYDLSKGMAKLLSPMLLGHQIEGIWHTGIVVFGREYVFGGGGISSFEPKTTLLGPPLKVERQGVTFVPFQVFSDYIQGLATSTYTASSYNIYDHNCNNFTEEVSQFLCGCGIPKYILDLPKDETLRQSVGPLLNNFLQGLTGGQTVLANGVRQRRQDSPEFMTLNNQIEEARLQSQALEEKRNTLSEKLARKERKKEKKKKKQQLERERLGLPPEQDTDMAECAEIVNGNDLATGPLAGPAAIQLEDERLEDEEKKRRREQPIVFKDLDATQVFDALVESLESVQMNEEEQQSLDELHQYLVQGEGSWALGDNFLQFIGRLLTDTSVSETTRFRLLRCLAACALRDDVSLLLHQDRRDHTLMNYAHAIDTLPLAEQKGLALFLCNLFESISASEWLLYISEWQRGSQQISNIRATTKAAIHSLLSDDADLRDIGTALVYNIATKEVKTVVFDDVSVELTMAILQHLSTAPGEEQLYRSTKALARLSLLSGQDVPQLIQMIGPCPDAYKGTSPRIDEQIEIIMRKIK